MPNQFSTPPAFITCEICGKTVRVKAHRLATARFCSRKCQGAAKATSHPWTTAHLVSCHCLVCGTSFTRRPSEVRQYGGRYCSQACANRSKEKAPEDFWALLDKSGPCWEWTRSRSPRGYGSLHYRGKAIRAHRLAWELAHGPIPPGLFVCHHCDNPSCCNPDHLFLGTHRDNMADRGKKGRVAHNRNGLGRRPATAKLTTAQAQEIRTLYAAGGESHASLAQRFGVGKTTIGNVLQGHLYRPPLPRPEM